MDRDNRAGDMVQFSPPVSGENRESYNDLVLIQYIFLHSRMSRRKEYGVIYEKR